MNIEVCRICGTTENLKFIFGEGKDELIEQIRLCANIQIDPDDCLPKFVCNECENGLGFSYRLRKRGEETEKKLRQDLLQTTSASCSNDALIVEHPDDNLIEEFFEDEVWIDEEVDAHYTNQEILIDTVTDLKEESLQGSQLEVPDYVTEEQWIEEQTDSSLENQNQIFEEISHVTAYESVEDHVEEIIEFKETESDSSLVSSTESPESTEQGSQQTEFQCEICLEVLDNRTQYQEHLSTHGDKCFHCGICEEWFAQQTRYEQHIKNHFISEKAFACAYCPKSYTNQGNMERHVRAAHKQERNFQCTLCTASFARSDILKMHMAKHTDIRSIECKICQKRYKTNQSLHYHMRIHNRPAKRPKIASRLKIKKIKVPVFLCDYCDKVSHHRTTHLNHVRTHTGERPFECSYCEKRFRTAHARTNHEMVHTDRRPHKCKICGTAFRQISHLKAHMLTHSGDRSYVCDVCQKAFAMRSNLIVHLRIHTGEMPYACDKCPKKYFLSSQFKRHMIHHRRKERLQIESSKENKEENADESRDGMSMYIDDIIEGTPEDFEEYILTPE